MICPTQTATILWTLYATLVFAGILIHSFIIAEAKNTYDVRFAINVNARKLALLKYACGNVVVYRLIFVLYSILYVALWYPLGLILKSLIWTLWAPCLQFWRFKLYWNMEPFVWPGLTVTAGRTPIPQRESTDSDVTIGEDNTAAIVAVLVAAEEEAAMSAEDLDAAAMSAEQPIEIIIEQ